jgi:hypothetical protein
LIGCIFYTSDVETQEPSGSGGYVSLDTTAATVLVKSMPRPPPRSGLYSRELFTLVASDNTFDMWALALPFVGLAWFNDDKW